MRFTGKNLVLVRDALVGAQSDYKNQVATCPDPDYFSDELDALEAQVKVFDRLLSKVEKAIAKESSE